MIFGAPETLRRALLTIVVSGHFVHRISTLIIPLIINGKHTQKEQSTAAIFEPKPQISLKPIESQQKKRKNRFSSKNFFHFNFWKKIRI